MVNMKGKIDVLHDIHTERTNDNNMFNVNVV